MGASEAVYRFFPGMMMKRSNLGTVFVQTGFPEHRSIFFKKVSDDDESLDDEEDDGEEENEAEFSTSAKAKNVKLKDKEGNFKQGTSIHGR